MVLFYYHKFSNKFSNMGIQRKCVSFISMVLFYGHKFSNMGIQRKCVSFYFYGAFYFDYEGLWWVFKIFKVAFLKKVKIN